MLPINLGHPKKDTLWEDVWVVGLNVLQCGQIPIAGIFKFPCLQHIGGYIVIVEHIGGHILIVTRPRGGHW